MYITSLGGGSDGGTGVPTCTEDLIDIAQGDLYLNASNPFIGGGYRGQCTWWCWTRCMQLTGVNMPTCNARDWVARTTLPTGTEPRARSVWRYGITARDDSTLYLLRTIRLMVL